jgi:carbamoyl-phosphate synthase large subunit
VRAVVPKEIIDKRGITRIAVTRRQPAIDRLCQTIQERFRADGPFNVQLRLDARDGTPVPFEINPRFSTTITLTQAAGVDELGGLVDVALGRRTGAEAWTWREGVTMVRRTVDMFMQFNDFAERRRIVYRS